MKAHVLALVLIVCCQCNLWDNIYSQALADTPIILSESLNFQFKVQDNLNVRLDFNAQLEVITIFVYVEVLVQVEVMKAQIDLVTLVLTLKRFNSKQCERYNIAALKGTSIEQKKLSKERLFLVNIFFKFVGKTKSLLNKPTSNIFKLEPFLLSAPPTEKLKKLQEQVKAGLKEEGLETDYKPDVQLYLHVDSVNGNLESIYSGEKQQTKVPFSTISTIRNKFACDTEIHSMSSKDLKKILDFVEEQRKKP